MRTGVFKFVHRPWFVEDKDNHEAEFRHARSAGVEIRLSNAWLFIPYSNIVSILETD